MKPFLCNISTYYYEENRAHKFAMFYYCEEQKQNKDEITTEIGHEF